MTQKPEERAKLYDILKNFSTAMFVTFGIDARLEARPMHIAQVEQEAGRIWFFTCQGSTLVDELRRQAVVLLAFQQENSSYLSLRGRARMDQNRTLVRDFWKETYKVWFPGGPEDPEIALIQVDLLDAEYWDNRGINKLAYLFEAAKAYVKGDTPEISDDQHMKVTL
jgi:general stress protein 26